MAVSGPGTTPYGGHAGPVNSVAFTPDGAALASAGDDGIVKLWDIRSGEQQLSLTGHNGRVRCVAFAPDGSTIASSGNDRTVRLWNARSGEQQATLTDHNGAVLSAVFAPDGTILASADGSGGVARLWDARTGQLQATLTGHQTRVWCVAFAPDSATLASGDGSGTVRLWDTRTGKQRASLARHIGPVLSVAFARDRVGILASGDDRGTVRLWDTRTGQQRAQLEGHGGPVYSVAITPDGASLASGDSNGTVRLWDTHTGQQRAQLDGHQGSVNSVAFAPDGATFASGGNDGTVRIWDTRTGQEQTRLAAHNGLVYSVAISPDGATLASGGNDQAVRLWDTRGGEQQALLPGHTGRVRCVGFGLEGTILASSSDRTVRLWDTRSGQQRAQLDGHNGPVFSVALASDGTTLASGDGSGTVRLWNAHSGEQRTQLEGHSGPVYSVAFAPDGATLASGGDDGTVRLWNAHSGERQAQLEGHSGPVYSVAFAPDGATLASGGSDRSVRLWDTRSGQQQATILGHNGRVRCVAFAPNGGILASGGDDGTVRLWDARSGGQQATLAGHNAPVFSLAFAPDGATLASAGDITIRIWNPRNATQIDATGLRAPRRVGRPLAGVRSDAPSAEDLIGVSSDVETLADLIAAAETSPPLAIALIGDWGAGKSSVMLQVQQRIEILADMSRNNPGLSLFASNVRQVRFNAWDYSDDQLWSGLIEHLFQTLAADPVGSPDTRDPGALRAESAALRKQLAERQADEQRLNDALSAADRTRQPEGFLAGLGSPVYAWRIVIAAIGELSHNIRASMPWLLGWGLLGAAAYGAWWLWGPAVGTTAAVIAGVIAPAVVIGNRLRRWHRSGMGFIVQLRRSLDGQQEAFRHNEAELRACLAVVDASARLSAFLEDRGTPHAYQDYRGLLGKVRSDLEQLSGDLRDARTEWLASGATTQPPLERIVLYIDDLDRCPPRRVVEVLEAIHLMLALELFVVVAAVDARWLTRSLEYHYRELFSVGDMRESAEAARSLESDVDEGPASPVDYLDKIFQIPYVLAAPQTAALASYLRLLLPRPSGVKVSASEAPHSEPAAEHVTESELDTTATGGRPNPEHELAAQARSPYDTHIQMGDEGNDREDEEQAVASQMNVPSSPIPELHPLGLQLSQPEVEFMTRLGPLLPTPRAAKRLVNLYRLVRIGISDSDLAAFTGSQVGGPYQVVQILLAVLVGSPSAAQRIFMEVMSAPADGDILTVFAQAANAQAGASRRDREVGTVCAHISAELARIANDTPLMVATLEYQRWSPRLGRYSFHTRTMTAQQSSADLPQTRR